MPFPVTMARWQTGFHLLCGFALCGGVGAAPLFPPVKDIPKGEVRVRVLVLSAAMEDAAQWVLEHDGTVGGLASRFEREAEKHHALEVVRAEVTGKPGALKKAASAKVRVIAQCDASHLWEAEQQAMLEGEPLPDQAEVLDIDMERNIGVELEADVPAVPGDLENPMRLQFTYTRPHEERPTTNWPLTRGTKAPRIIVCPWTLGTHGAIPLGRPVVLGVQMEPPHEGEVSTGKVWIGLAQLDCGAGFETPQEKALPDETDLTAWIFSVPNPLAASWLAARKDGSGDAATLREWLAAPHAKGGPVFSALMHAGEPDFPVTSERYWEDGSGFSPSPYEPDSRALSENDDEYRLRYEIAAQTSSKESDPTSVSGLDPFAPTRPVPPGKVAPPPVLDAEVSFSLPPHAARWTRYESAMEKRPASDPGALELASVGVERVILRKELMHGAVTLGGAWPQGDRTRVVFLRSLRAQATARVEQRPKAFPGPGAATLWIVDTVVSQWLPKLAAAGAIDEHGLAAEVLVALQKREAELAAVLHCGLEIGDRAIGSSKPGDGHYRVYLNTRPYPGGIPYAPRIFEPNGGGWEWKGNFSPADDPAYGIKMSLEITGQTAPMVSRRWGVCLAQQTPPTPEKSGVNLPVWSTCAMNISRELPWNTATILGVTRHEAKGAGRLRWTIARCDAPAGSAEAPGTTVKREVADPFAGNWMQVMLVGMKPEVAEQLQSGGDKGSVEKRWLAAITDGRARLIDLAMSAVELTGTAAMTTGKVTTFPESRFVEGVLERHTAVPREPPPGTQFASQLDLREHVGGIDLVLEPTELTLMHDGAFEVVTDTLTDTYEFPYNSSEGKPVNISVSVQRPVFTPHVSRTPWPPKDFAQVIPWNGAPPPGGEKWFFLVRCVTSSPRK